MKFQDSNSSNLHDLETLLFQIFSNDSKSILFIDDFEICARAPQDDNESSSMNVSLKSLFHRFFDKLVDSKHVFLVAIANNVDNIDSSFKQAGKLDSIIYIPIPLENQRIEIIKFFVKQSKWHIDDETCSKLSSVCVHLHYFYNNKHFYFFVQFTPGFVGRDLQRLIRMAILSARHHYSNNNINNVMNTKEEQEEHTISWEHAEYALSMVKPLQLLEIGHGVPSVEWDQIGGYEKIKKRCKELMYWPLLHPEAFERFGLPLSSGILLHGPSGCGKTLLVKALASMGKMNYISVKWYVKLVMLLLFLEPSIVLILIIITFSSELFSKYVGETESVIRNLFKKAKQLAPCVLVFDEIDSIAPRRDDDSGQDEHQTSNRALSQLLTEMDGISSRKQVFIVGCTNRLDQLDDAVKRPGRLDQLILVPMPSESDRMQVLKAATSKMPLSDSVSLEYLAKKTEEMSCADLIALAREAALIALRKDLEAKQVTADNFEQALSEIKRI